jgi:hypothetical protein
MDKRTYKGESELEFYKLLDPDDDVPRDPLLECEGCGDFVEELTETYDMVRLCDPCYRECQKDNEELDEEGWDRMNIIEAAKILDNDKRNKVLVRKMDGGRCLI